MGVLFSHAGQYRRKGGKKYAIDLIHREYEDLRNLCQAGMGKG
jgi:hypothetical protein